jgi:methylated-DNA-protein-cysteine methyltransferase related protein
MKFMQKEKNENSTYKQQVIALVNQIPAGKVTNFGTIGQRIGISGQMVGWILSGMKEEEWSLCPWYRVVAKDGFVSSLKLGSKGLVQTQILVSQGYNFVGDCVDMSKHFWNFEVEEALL